MADSATNNAYVTAEWVRRPLADLGGVAPADAVNDPQARKKLEDLFTELAGHHVRLSNLGLPSFDPHDLRRALGMETASPAAARQPIRMVRTGPVKRNALLEELGTALTGGDVDSVAFFNIKTGAVEHFMHNLGDQETARISQAQANEEMHKIAPVTTDVRYSIMSDFIGLVEDMNVAGRLRSAISGKGAFRRFREAVDEDDNLRRRWLSYRTKRHYLLALDWLQKLGLNPAQYSINPSDYDWHPHAPLETPAAAGDSGQGAAGTEVASTVVEAEKVMEDEGGMPSGAAAEEAVEPTPLEGQEPAPEEQSNAVGSPSQ
ncbi:MAG: hypothetical protein DLM53_09860 [Candidatus Eremiobacter antarcticus]|nr:hypothetical protein [Candidatus Eremiobacteraeota bacterium]MBC5808585.1 hypothetical protein [Candidatus Eremiobacteraeota bacterium]PZR61148.1 MAG: hypothetical protein DLM53_09860 [Candidatus Eremiobacter sp. RRmetagenome_bin22]